MDCQVQSFNMLENKNLGLLTMTPRLTLLILPLYGHLQAIYGNNERKCVKKKKENKTKTQVLNKKECLHYRSKTVKCLKMDNCKLIRSL